jgi:AcrR family transcriptional regulator
MRGSFSDAFKGNQGEKRVLLEAAAEVFARKGYHRTTVDEIARAIGVAKGTIYYHFENKEDLYLAIIREGVYLFKEQLGKAVATSVSTPDKISKLIDEQLLFYEQEKDLVFLFLKELCNTDLRREVLAEMLTDCLKIIRVVIEEGIRDGSLEAVDPEITTPVLFGMVSIAALHYLSYNREIPRKPVSKVIGQIFFKGICIPKA